MKETNVKRNDLIRLGGLVAMLCGVLYVVGRYRSSLEAGPPFVLLLVGAMVATGCVAFLLQRERYGRPGVLASLVSFVGLALVLWANQVINSIRGTDPQADWAFTALTLGILAATVGLVVLAIITTNARVLPWWFGVALVAGSPFGVLLLMMLPSMFSESLLEGPWQLAVEALVGVPWVLVGYAVFRAGSRRSEQHSRVR
jgi:drug/metabolite transporter (DMT)-like permease